MLIEEGLRRHLVDLDVVEERVYPQILPQNPTYPAISYSVISSAVAHTVEGLAGYARTVFQVSVWAKTTNADGSGYEQAREIAEELRVSLSGFRGYFGDVQVHSCFLTGRRDLYSNDAIVFGTSLDFAVSHEEAR